MHSTYLYQDTFTLTLTLPHTHTQSPKLFISHIFAAWFSGETKSTSKITLECIALPFSDDSFESPARLCLSLYIYFIMSDLFFSAALPPYCISLVFFSLFHSSFTLVLPRTASRCQYLTWFLFYPIYLFIIRFRNHFCFFPLDYSMVHGFIGTLRAEIG